MRPYVIVHMMSPLDGRLDVTRWSCPPGVTMEDRMKVYDDLHRELDADGWLVGSSTMKEFAKGPPHPPTSDDKPPRPLHRAKTNLRRFAVAIDRRAVLHWTGPSANGDHVLVLLGAGVGDDHLRELIQDRISYFVAPDDSLPLATSLEILAEQFGIERLLIEGGGRLVGAAFEARSVDEFSLVLYPTVDGSSGSPTIVEAGPEGVTTKPVLRLLSQREIADGVLWIRYAVGFPTTA